MELRSKVLYRGIGVVLKPGHTTEGLGLTEKRKAQMLADFPDWFEVIEDVKGSPEDEPAAEEELKPKAKPAPKPRRAKKTS